MNDVDGPVGHDLLQGRVAAIYAESVGSRARPFGRARQDPRDLDVVETGQGVGVRGRGETGSHQSGSEPSPRT
jgi:hypothetical protein